MKIKVLTMTLLGVTMLSDLPQLGVHDVCAAAAGYNVQQVVVDSTLQIEGMVNNAFDTGDWSVILNAIPSTHASQPVISGLNEAKATARIVIEGQEAERRRLAEVERRRMAPPAFVPPPSPPPRAAPQNGELALRLNQRRVDLDSRDGEVIDDVLRGEDIVGAKLNSAAKNDDPVLRRVAEREQRQARAGGGAVDYSAERAARIEREREEKANDPDPATMSVKERMAYFKKLEQAKKP